MPPKPRHFGMTGRMTNPTAPKILLMDADGVIIRPPRPFSQLHADQRSFEAREIEPFFEGDFRLATVGKADVKELINKHRDLWHWDGTPDELLRRWFEAEHHIDHELLNVLQQIRAAGVPVYLATDQEKYRAAYLRDVMFPGKFDGAFISCEIGYEKTEPEFFIAVLEQLRAKYPAITPADIAFFDDSPAKVESARTLGIAAQFYANRSQIDHILTIIV
jgi:putative hydrolase of the HAD superfamily